MNFLRINRFRFFIVAYIAVFMTLAGCGYIVINQKRMVRQQGDALMTHEVVTDLAYYDLPRITVSVGTNGDHLPPRLRADISLEVARKDMHSVAGYQPRITEKLSDLLASIRPEDLESSLSVPQLRAEMLRAVNRAGAPVPVHDLLFRELVIM